MERTEWLITIKRISAENYRASFELEKTSYEDKARTVIAYGASVGMAVVNLGFTINYTTPRAMVVKK